MKDVPAVIENSDRLVESGFNSIYLFKFVIYVWLQTKLERELEIPGYEY